MEANKMKANDKECSHDYLSNLHVSEFWHCSKKKRLLDNLLRLLQDPQF